MNTSHDLSAIEIKQAYVYNKILKDEYDIEAFAQFLAQQGPKYTSNLDEISCDQIESAVNAFIKSHKPQRLVQTPTQRPSMPESKIQHSNIGCNNTNLQMKSIKCVKQINKFALTSIQVNVISYQKHEGSFLHRDYITFKIDLPQLHRQIDRRYSHFEWLRDILVYYHPGVIVPPLPKKKMKKIFTDNHLKKKGKMLENFLRKSLQIPDLRNDQNMYRFLTISTISMLEEFLKGKKAEKGFIPFSEIKSATGYFEYGTNEQTFKINKVAAQYFPKFTPFMKQLYKQIKRVKQALDSCATHLDNLNVISIKFTPVEARFRRECNRKTLNGHDQREKSFIDTISVIAQYYKQLFYKCRKHLKAMAETWEKQLYNKMKYEFHLSDHISNFIAEYQAEERKFYSLKDSLQKKKLKLYSKQMSEWGLNEEKLMKFISRKPSLNQAAPFMLWRKTEQVQMAQEIYALQAKQLCNSIVNYAQSNNLYNLKSADSFLQKEHQMTTLWLQTLKDLITCKLNFSQIGVNQKMDSSPTGVNQKMDSSPTGVNQKIDSSPTGANCSLESSMTSVNQKMNSSMTGVNCTLESSMTQVNQKMNSSMNKVNYKLDFSMTEVNHKMDFSMNEVNHKMDFSMNEVNTANEKLGNTAGNTLKGFFGQLAIGNQKPTDKGYTSIQTEQPKGKIFELGEPYF